MVAASKLRNIGIIAHIDAGKTTTTERILFYTKREHKMGEVHDGTTVTDWMDEEKERGITITSAATSVEWGDAQINIIDTPGHVDFTAEVERSLRVLDGAVGVFCGVAGVQAQSETVWKQADRYNVPRLIFVNKLDRTGADFHAVVDDIRKTLNVRPLLLQLPVGKEKDLRGVIDLVGERLITFGGKHGDEVEEGPIPEDMKVHVELHRAELIETAVEVDEELMARYLEDDPISTDELKAAIRKGVLKSLFTPIFCGSALRNVGVQPLLDGVVDYLPSPKDVSSIQGLHPKTQKPETRKMSAKEPFAALCFKVHTSDHGELYFLRIYSGTVKLGQAVHNSTRDRKERLMRLLLMHANDRTQVKEAVAGDIVAVMGLKFTATGDTLCDKTRPILLESIAFPETVISMAIEPKTLADKDKLLEVLNRIAKEDPTFTQRIDEETGQIIISGMGELHLDVIRNRLIREFSVRANVGKPRVAYKQTVSKELVGEHEFVRQATSQNQYAKVQLKIEPLPELGKVKVAFDVDEDDVPKQYWPAIEEAVRSAAESGLTWGYPVINIQVTCVGGAFNPAESSPEAFSAAASIAFKDALEESGTTLLEPLMEFEIQVPTEFYGNIIHDLNGRRASIKDVAMSGEDRILRGTVPLSSMFGYSTTVRSLSQGRAAFSMEPCDYAAVPEHLAPKFF